MASICLVNKLYVLRYYIIYAHYISREAAWMLTRHMVRVNGKKIRTLRQRLLMSQKELSRASGVGQDTISHIEREKIHPRGKTIRRLAKALETDPYDLMK